MMPVTDAGVTRALLGDEWFDLPDMVQQAAVAFLSEVLDTDADNDLDDVAWSAADAACPIYYNDQLAMLVDPVMSQWLDGVDTGFRPDDAVSLVQAACSMVTVAFVSGLSGLFGRMTDKLQTAEGLAAFGLSPVEAETALGLWQDWSGTIVSLIDAARALEEVQS